MAEVLRQFSDLVLDGRRAAYRAQACGAPTADGMWQGWIEFLPVDGAPPIRSARETTQPNRDDTVYWATGLTAVYLEGSLERTLRAPREIPVPAESAFEGPARSQVNREVTATGREAVLDPFSIYAKGATLLRRQLAALSVWHLVNIIDAYELSDESSAVLNAMPREALVDMIVGAVAAQVDESPARK
jgi:hypothetical protein